MALDAAELAHRLARDAEAVCRHYLSAGRREGRYWLVGDVRNTPGRSMFVPADAAGPAILAKVLERYPLARVAERAAA